MLRDMKKITRSRRPGTRRKVAAEALPKDHLPPRAGRTDQADAPGAPPRDGPSAPQVAQRTPGEANIGVRPHLEGSEQGPQ